MIYSSCLIHIFEIFSVLYGKHFLRVKDLQWEYIHVIYPWLFVVVVFIPNFLLWVKIIGWTLDLVEKDQMCGTLKSFVYWDNMFFIDDLCKGSRTTWLQNQLLKTLFSTLNNSYILFKFFLFFLVISLYIIGLLTRREECYYKYRLQQHIA